VTSNPPKILGIALLRSPNSTYKTLFTTLKLRRSLDTTALTSPKLGLLSKAGLEAYLAVIEMKQGTKTPQHYHRYRVITFSLCIWLSCSFAPKPTQQRIKFPQVAAHRRFAEADEELVGIAREASYIQPLHDRQPIISRARLFEYSSKIVGLMSLLHPATAYAKCTDIESCREEGERKIEADLKLNPIMKLSDGVRYRVLQPSTLPSAPKVKEGSSIDLIYSISTASGQYMYSKGFGFEKVSFGGKQQSDLGLDSMRIVVGKQNVPVGIESALI
jgi:hypothetical protein